MHVLFEGIMFQDGALQRFLTFNRMNSNVVVIELTTPIQDCIAGVQKRRDEREDKRPLNPKNTIARAERVRKNCSRLRDAGLKVPKLDSEGAYLLCLQLLGWTE